MKTPTSLVYQAHQFHNKHSIQYYLLPLACISAVAALPVHFVFIVRAATQSEELSQLFDPWTN